MIYRYCGTQHGTPLPKKGIKTLVERGKTKRSDDPDLILRYLNFLTNFKIN